MEDQLIIFNAKRALASGVALKRWWEKIDTFDDYTDRYPESFVYHRPDDVSFGFFATARTSTSDFPVIGNVQEMFYDRPKDSSPQFIQRQIREFVMRYFMRVSDFRDPQPVSEPGHPKLPKLLQLISRCPSDEFTTQGFGYSQRYYKLFANGEEARFPVENQDSIVDLRELFDEYAWIVIKNPIEDFKFDFQPLGVRGPRLTIPVPAANFLVLSRDTITVEENPCNGILGRYGIGYAFMRDVGEPGLFAYGPGQLEPAFQLVIWEVLDTGEVRVRMTFVSHAPEGLINVSLNPLTWGVTLANLSTSRVFAQYIAPVQKAINRLPFSDLTIDPIRPTVRWLNLLTGNYAAKYFCISQREIDKELLYIHFLQHYNAVLGSMQTWRQFPDWTDAAKLPTWVKTGQSAYGENPGPTFRHGRPITNVSRPELD